MDGAADPVAARGRRSTRPAPAGRPPSPSWRTAPRPGCRRSPRCRRRRPARSRRGDGRWRPRTPPSSGSPPCGPCRTSASPRPRRPCRAGSRRELLDAGEERVEGGPAHRAARLRQRACTCRAGRPAEAVPASPGLGVVRRAPSPEPPVQPASSAARSAAAPGTYAFRCTVGSSRLGAPRPDLLGACRALVIRLPRRGGPCRQCVSHATAVDCRSVVRFSGDLGAGFADLISFLCRHPGE